MDDISWRKLLYTAVTRAEEELVIVDDQEKEATVTGVTTKKRKTAHDSEREIGSTDKKPKTAPNRKKKALNQLSPKKLVANSSDAYYISVCFMVPPLYRADYSA